MIINKELFKNVLNWFLIVLILLIIIIPYVLFVVYLNRKEKKLILYPEIKIVDIKSEDAPDIDDMSSAVSLSKRILEKIKKV